MSANTANNSNPAKSCVDFLTLARGLKTTPRTGWVRQEAGPKIESVADHSWRISLMAMVATFSSSENDDDESTKLDSNKCVKMALVHDLAEATVGDITPYCGISDKDKHQLELEAITKMTTLLPLGGDEIQALWKEYEEGTSNEAKLVKDLDKLEMIMQALEYETDGENGKSLDGFFDSTRGKWRTKLGEQWGKEIEARRNTGSSQSNDNATEDTAEEKQPDDKKAKLS